MNSSSSAADRKVFSHRFGMVARRSAAGAAVLATLVPAAPIAFAQDVAARGGLEEVLVTARRREESAQSVPLVVTAIDGSSLRAAGVDDLGDLTKIVPAFSINDGTGRRNAPNYAIRAIRPTESIYGQDPSVAVYFADVVINPAEGSNLALFDLQNVQVLKGPQGTLFGRNTNGGAVLFTPRRPGDTLGAEVAVGYGRFSMIETEFGVDLPISDRFRTRLAGKTYKRDGYQKNVLSGDEMGGENAKSVRLSAIWNITDSIENYSIVSYDRARGQARAPVIIAARPGTTAAAIEMANSLARQRARGDIDRVEANDLSQFGTRGDYEDVDVWAGYNTTTIELGNGLTLKNIFGMRHVNYESAFDADGSSAPQALETRQPADMHHWSDEIQLLGTAFDDKLSWQTGLYYYQEEGSQRSDGRVFGIQQYPGGTIDDESYSIYAQGTYTFSPQWSLTVGGRYTKDEKSIVAMSQAGGLCAVFDENGVRLPLDSCGRKASASFSSPTGTISLEYKPYDGALFYLASRYGYRAGGLNIRATVNQQFEPFDPEYVTDLEFGAKLDWELGDWRFRTNIALFHQWYEDIQRTISETAIIPPAVTPIVITTVQNAAKATVDGAEFEATISPTDSLTLRLTYAYLDPKYKNWSDTILVGGQPQARDLSSTPFQFIPKHQGSASVRYEVPLGDASAFGRLELQGTYSAQSAVYVNAFGTIADMQDLPQDVLADYKQKSYDQLDLHATWAEMFGRPIDLSIYVKNATDDRHVVGGVFQYKGIGFNDVVYNDPRTYGLQLRYRFEP